MSELNEALLSDDNDDCVDIEEAEEEALLQDDPEDDLLNISELKQSDTDPNDSSLLEHEEETREEKSSRKDKFATERKPITAPESSDDNEPQKNNSFPRYNNRGGKGGKFQQQFRQRGDHRFQPGRQFINNRNNNLRGQNIAPRGKKVFVNPNFQGVVNVNNNTARLAWDPHQQQQSNPWVNNVAPGNMMPPQMQTYQPPQQHFQPPMQQLMHQMQPAQNMGPPPMQGPPQMQFVPQYQPPFGAPQHQGPPLQPHNSQHPYWDGQMQVPTALPLQAPNPQQNMMPYMQPSYEPPQPIIINTANPPPNMQQNFQYNGQFNQNMPHNMQPPPQQQQQQPEFMPNNFQNPDVLQVSFNNQRNHFHNNLEQQDSFSPKRKVGTGNFSQNKRRVQERLGVKLPQMKLKSPPFKGDDRPSVMKEVTVTEVTTVKYEDDDATNDLRKKIEEQKRKRAEILRWKELRRLENLKEAGKLKEEQIEAQVIRPVQRFSQGQARGRGGHQQQNRTQQHQSMANRKPVLHQLTQVQSPSVRGSRGGAKTARGVLNNRVVTVKPAAANSSLQLAREEEEEEDGSDVKLDQAHLSNFLESRKVLAADKTLLTTRKVVIRNISTSTGDKKIIQICKDIGEVQKLHRDNNERHATITFKSVASAHAFFKKYQRHLLDLSMIEVSLTPESAQE